jgi:uncharacterized membrane protein YfcA
MSGEIEFYLLAVRAVTCSASRRVGFPAWVRWRCRRCQLVDSPVRAAAILLPVLVVQDWVRVWAFRRDFSSRNLIILVPSSVIGVALGWLLAARVSDDVVRLAVRVISIGFVLYMLIRDRLGLAPIGRPAVP